MVCFWKKCINETGGEVPVSRSDGGERTRMTRITRIIFFKPE